MTDSDFDLMLTKDPKRFMAMLIASIWFDMRGGDTDPGSEKYYPVFKKWLAMYNADQLREFEQGIAEAHKKQLEEALAAQEPVIELLNLKPVTALIQGLYILGVCLTVIVVGVLLWLR